MFNKLALFVAAAASLSSTVLVDALAIRGGSPAASGSLIINIDIGVYLIQSQPTKNCLCRDNTGNAIIRTASYALSNKGSCAWYVQQNPDNTCTMTAPGGGYALGYCPSAPGTSTLPVLGMFSGLTSTVAGTAGAVVDGALGATAGIVGGVAGTAADVVDGAAGVVNNAVVGAANTGAGAVTGAAGVVGSALTGVAGTTSAALTSTPKIIMPAVTGTNQAAQILFTAPGATTMVLADQTSGTGLGASLLKPQGSANQNWAFQAL